MLRRLFTPMSVALLSGGLLIPSLNAQSNNTNSTTAAMTNGSSVQIQELTPFTHLAYISVGVDLGSIRFDKVRAVKVPTRIKYTMDSEYCSQLAFRDPGGSIACPYTQTEAPVPAYEVTYSFVGQPLASDEHADRSFTFSVYFRPDELAPDMQQALSARKLNRADVAAYFAVSTSREAVRRVAIDDKQSHFCEANLLDGSWVRVDAGCQDSVRYTAVAVPSDYITVKVEPVVSRLDRAVVASTK